MRASFPVVVANSIAASTLGPIEPAAKSILASASGWAREMARCCGVPQPV